MDIKNIDGKEICHSQKKMNSDKHKDFISDLPDPILVHILSFLPIKDAISTVLLRRFGDLWRSVEVLDFSSCLYHDCEDEDYLPDYLNLKFADLIQHVLDLHESSTLDKLCLKFGFALHNEKCELQRIYGHDGDLEIEKRIADQIEKLICFAISKKVKVLDLNLKGCNGFFRECYDLPDVLSSNYLTYLKLAAFEITSCKRLDLKSLSVLLLDQVLLSDDVMEEILLGCPSLENLSLIDCYGLENLIIRNPNLKKVMVSLDVMEDRQVAISCPYLLYLELYGWIKRVCLLDVSSIVDGSIFFSQLYWDEQEKYDDVRRFLNNFSRCTTFSPCTWSILALTVWNFTNMPCPSFECKNLRLKLNLTKWHLPGLSLLLRSSQSLETITLYIYPSSQFLSTIEKAKWIEAYEFDGERYWDSHKVTFPCLETIMIYGYVDERYLFQMVQFLLNSTPRLQKLEISTKISLKLLPRESWLNGSATERLQPTSEQLQELLQKFNLLPRASPKAMVCFS